MKKPYYFSEGIEVIDIIDAFNLNFELGNVIKYVLRAGKKNPQSYTDDLLKAMYYIEREITRYALVETEKMICQNE